MIGKGFPSKNVEQVLSESQDQILIQQSSAPAEAAHAVLTTGLKNVILAPLDVTHQLETILAFFLKGKAGY